VVVCPVLVLTAHSPPEAGLEAGSHEHRVVSSAYVVLIGCGNLGGEL